MTTNKGGVEVAQVLSEAEPKEMARWVSVEFHGSISLGTCMGEMVQVKIKSIAP